MNEMNVIVGASGQVGSCLIKEMKRQGLPVRAVVRNAEKLSDKTIETKIADLFNPDQLTEAFKGGTNVFVITPENPASDDIIQDTKKIVGNYMKSIQAANIKKVVGLSCIGAQVEGNTGNILMSRILEQTLRDLEVEKVFIRPSYYFSNWLGYLESIKEYGVLPTFFPEDLKIEMNSPIDVAKFTAHAMAEKPSTGADKIYELEGQQKYSARDVAEIFSKLLRKDVTLQSIPREKWQETIMSAGFTKNTAENLIEMTQAVINNEAVPERKRDTIKLSSSLENYLEEFVTP